MKDSTNEPIIVEIDDIEDPDKNFFRKNIKRFPLDHWASCIKCDFVGKVEITMYDCPKCGVELIPPEEVEGWK